MCGVGCSFEVWVRLDEPGREGVDDEPGRKELSRVGSRWSGGGSSPLLLSLLSTRITDSELLDEDPGREGVGDGPGREGVDDGPGSGEDFSRVRSVGSLWSGGESSLLLLSLFSPRITKLLSLNKNY